MWKPGQQSTHSLAKRKTQAKNLYASPYKCDHLIMLKAAKSHKTSQKSYNFIQQPHTNSADYSQLYICSFTFRSAISLTINLSSSF